MDNVTNFNEAVRRLKANSNLSYFGEGSVIGSIIKGVNQIVTEQVARANAEIENYKIDTAIGSALDNIGKNLNIARRPETQNAGFITIEIDTSTFSSLNDLLTVILNKTGLNLTEIVIPSGTIITDSTGNKRYTLIDDLVLSENINSGEIISMNSGPYSQVESGELNTIENPSTQLLAINEYIKIYNSDPIVNGVASESDINYQYRLHSYAFLDQAANERAIRVSALGVPGVSNVRINKYKNGAGKTEVMVISETPIVSNGLLNLVKATLENVSSCAEDIIVTEPKYVGIYLQIFITFDKNSDESEQQNVLETIRKQINTYINSLQLGQDLKIREINNIIISQNIVNTYKIKTFISGEYDKVNGVILYPDILLETDQSVDINSKFVTNSQLIKVEC